MIICIIINTIFELLFLYSCGYNHAEGALRAVSDSNLIKLFESFFMENNFFKLVLPKR